MTFPKSECVLQSDDTEDSHLKRLQSCMARLRAWPDFGGFRGSGPLLNRPQAAPGGARSTRTPASVVIFWVHQGSPGIPLTPRVYQGSPGIPCVPGILGLWGPKGPKPAPNRPQTTPAGPRTTSNCSHMSCSHVHRHTTQLQRKSVAIGLRGSFWSRSAPFFLTLCCLFGLGTPGLQQKHLAKKPLRDPSDIGNKHSFSQTHGPAVFKDAFYVLLVSPPPGGCGGGSGLSFSYGDRGFWEDSGP